MAQQKHNGIKDARPLAPPDEKGAQQAGRGQAAPEQAPRCAALHGGFARQALVGAGQAAQQLVGRAIQQPGQLTQGGQVRLCAVLLPATHGLSGHVQPVRHLLLAQAGGLASVRQRRAEILHGCPSRLWLKAYHARGEMARNKLFPWANPLSGK